jgi:hypothetical protein
MAWTDEKRKKAVALYLEQNPTADTSIEIIESLVEELGETANGIRMVLIKEEVYVKKAPATAASASTEGKAAGEGGKRVSKESSIAALTDKLNELNAPVDEAIIDKLTGKAAIYFLSVLNSIK